MTAPAVSIVVAAYNAARTLPPLLRACQSQDLAEPYEILVVDDGSCDATRRVAEEAGVEVVAQDNRGPAAARNRGWREAKAPIVLFTDSDCVPHRDWARLLSQALEGECSVAGGSYGIANPGNPLAESIHAEIRWRHSRLGEEVEYAGSFNLGAKRTALESVDGFDESFANPSAEDNDLSYRLRKAGHRIRFVPRALVDHHHPTSLGRYLREQARHGRWRVVLYGRHPDRMKGDGYAGPLDFADPPLAVLSVAAGLAALVAPAALGMSFLLADLVLVLNVVLAARVSRHAGSAIPWNLTWIGFVRAYARGWGMLQGVVRLLLGGGRDR